MKPEKIRLIITGLKVHEVGRRVFREEIDGPREDIGKVRESVPDVRQEVDFASELIVEKIDDARKEISGETIIHFH
jgi:hypothetical protein